MATVVEEYISEGVQEIATYLKISQSLSAVTLLAFAGGAGEQITALVAGDTEGGISYNIGSIFGSGLFIASMVLPYCCQKASEGILRQDDMILFRDIGFYQLAILTIGLYAWDGTFTWIKSAVLLVLYLIVVLISVFRDILHKRKPENKLEKLLIENDNFKTTKSDLFKIEEECGKEDSQCESKISGKPDKKIETEQKIETLQKMPSDLSS